MIRSLLAVGVASLAVFAQAPARVDLDELLRQADARRREFTVSMLREAGFRSTGGGMRFYASVR